MISLNRSRKVKQTGYKRMGKGTERLLEAYRMARRHETENGATNDKEKGFHRD